MSARSMHTFTYNEKVYYDHVSTIIVGNDYFCESGIYSALMSNYVGVFFPDDFLWDGPD